MIGRKGDGKGKFRGAKLAIGILAMIGAAGIVKGSKKWIKEKCCKMSGYLKGKPCTDVSDRDE